MVEPTTQFSVHINQRTEFAAKNGYYMQCISIERYHFAV